MLDILVVVDGSGFIMSEAMSLGGSISEGIQVSDSGGLVTSEATGSEGSISKEEVKSSLLEEIEASLGSGSASKRLHEIEGQLQQMYMTLPKNEHGGLSHSVVRYALHRLFVQRHGWLVKGLDPAGGSFSVSSPTRVLKNRASSYIQELFDQRLREKGLSLHELAVFAATIEHLIHNEAVKRLGEALRLHKILPTSILNEKEADDVLDSYTMAYILGQDLKNMTLAHARDLCAQMPDLYLAWNETQQFMRGVRHNITASTPRHEINFETLATVVKTAGEHFGSFQDAECQEMKAKLVAIEDHGSGRVRLADFYRPALKGAWQFQESVGYLRQLGLLDEANPGNPRVIIVNYLVAKSNCIADNSFYSVCCMNECEALMGHIEAHVVAPEVQAENLSSIIANLSSSSVSVPRVLPSVLLDRLNAIADAHHGTVPIHGRLFAQWMHHAFPRECPYPHMSGTTSGENADEWAENELDPTATEEEMRQYTVISNKATANQVFDLGEVEILPWSSEEELLASQATGDFSEKAPPFSRRATLGLVLFLALLGPLALIFVRVVKSSRRGSSTQFKVFV